jgi:hypothetical protein
VDWNTEIESFWAFHDAQEVLERNGDVNSLVRELVAGQQDKIRAVANQHKDPENARLTLTIAVSCVGVQYSTSQKLLNALKDSGVHLAPDHHPPTADIFSPRAAIPVEGSVRR